MRGFLSGKAQIRVKGQSEADEAMTLRDRIFSAGLAGFAHTGVGDRTELASEVSPN